MPGHIVWQAPQKKKRQRDLGHSGMKTNRCRVILNVHESSTCRLWSAVGLSKDTQELQDWNDHHYNHNDLPLDNWASSIHFTSPQLLGAGTDCRNIAMCEVIIVMSLKITDSFDAMPCSPVHVYISVEIAAYHKDRRWQQVPAVCLYIYRVSQEECARLREGVPYVKVYRYNQNTYVQSWTVTEIMAREVWKYNSCYTLIDYQIHIKTSRNMWFL